MVAHGPKGGIGSIENIRQYATLDGNPIGEGADAKASIDLPPWFVRTGRVTYTVDTGFGVIRCRGVVAEDDDLLLLLKNDDKAPFGVVLDAIKSLPEDWRVEDEVTLAGTTLAVGDPLPTIKQAREFSDEDKRRFVTTVLPPSLLSQIVTGQRYVSLPPIPYTATADPR